VADVAQSHHPNEATYEELRHRPDANIDRDRLHGDLRRGGLVVSVLSSLLCRRYECMDA
jgi:hypothetical protein